MRIAQQIAHAFGIELDKDVVRRILAKHFRPESGNADPAWLSFIGPTKDSLWSIDLFRCESVLLCSHWVADAELKSLIRRSHELVLAKLPRKLQTALAARTFTQNTRMATDYVPGSALP